MASRPSGSLDLHVIIASHEDDAETRPPLGRGFSQFRTTHARHPAVGEHQRDIRTGLKLGQGLCAASRFEDLAAQLLEQIDCQHAHYIFIVDHKDDFLRNLNHPTYPTVA